MNGPVEEWICLTCTLLNSSGSGRCAACGDLPDNSKTITTKGVKRKQPEPGNDVLQLKMGTVISTLNEEISSLTEARQWACYRCSYHNSSNHFACDMCHAPRSRSASSNRSTMTNLPGPSRSTIPESRWSCDQCTFHNSSSVIECAVCGHRKMDSESVHDVESAIYENEPRTSEVQRQSSEAMSPRNFQRQQSANIASVRNRQEKDAKDTWQNIISYCRSQNEKFTDDSFPPTEKSLGNIPDDDMRPKFKRLVWRRPEEIYGRGFFGGKLELMRNPGPEDIEQGILGNCWFLSALAVVSEVPEFLERIIVTKDYNEFGVYQIRLCIDGQWKIITVDDYLPCDPGNGYPAFSRGKRSQLWVPIVEKALAKECGGYGALIAGRTLEGLSILTGVSCESIDLGGKHTENDFTAQSEYLDIVWAKMLSAKEAGYIMGCSCGARFDRPISEDTFDAVGLTSSHAYSLLDVQEINGGTKLVKLRNPWGSFVWKGEWSHGSSQWTQGLRTLLLPEGKKPGVFWMPYDQFCTYFNNVEIAKTRRGWEELRLSCFLNPHARNGYVQSFRLIVTDNQEIDLTLYQENFRHENQQRSGIVDLGFIILKEGAHQESRSMEFETWSRRKIYSFVSADHIFTPGCYLIVLTSFSHWGIGLNTEEIPRAILALHSPSPVFVERFQASQFLLAEALAITIRAVGKCHSGVSQGSFSGIRSWYLQNGFAGQAVMLENHFEDRYLQVQTNCADSTNVISTRGSLEVADTIPPLHRQIIVVLSQLESTSSYHVSHRLQYRVTRDPRLNDWSRQLLGYSGSEALQHVPELSGEVSGLHSPRPFIS